MRRMWLWIGEYHSKLTPCEQEREQLKLANISASLVAIASKLKGSDKERIQQAKAIAVAVINSSAKDIQTKSSTSQVALMMHAKQVLKARTYPDSVPPVAPSKEPCISTTSEKHSIRTYSAIFRRL